MNKCKNCGTELKIQTIYKYGEGGSHKIIGQEFYCPNMKCDYREDIK